MLTKKSRLYKIIGSLWPKNRIIPEHDHDSRVDSLALNAFVEDQIGNRPFNAVLSENDEMYLFALRAHQGNKDRATIEILSTGKQSFNVVRSIVEWKFGGLSNVNSFLDFAGGYGRLTRFLVQYLSPSKIWACDIYQDALQFQSQQFGVNTLVSTLSPEDYHDKRRYDFIFVASLFSHLPEDNFIGWLSKLYNLLTPVGILVFSVHDTAVTPPHLGEGDKDILFAAESESRTLDKNIYGTSYVSENFVRGAILKATGKTFYHREKRGLWSFQDVYVISKDDRVNFKDLDVSQGPSGYLDVCRITKDGELFFEGWAADFSKKADIKSVEILLNGKIILSCPSTNERLDVENAFQNRKGLHSGFSFTLPKENIQPEDVLLVKIVNTNGVDHVLRAGNLSSILDK